MNDTKYAAEGLILLIRGQEIKIKELEDRVVQNRKLHDHLYQDFIKKDFDPDGHFDEIKMMHSFQRQASFHEIHIEPLMKQLAALESSIKTKQESISSLSGSLLQIAKQGISKTHGNPKNWPEGRNIRNETLSNIIRQGRNQALHFEEHKDLKDEIITCFLKIEIPLEKYKNSAKEVIDLLGWNLYEDYEKDMKSLK